MEITDISLIIVTLFSHCYCAGVTLSYEIDEERQRGELVANLLSDSGIKNTLDSSSLQMLVFTFGSTRQDYSAYFALDNKTGVLRVAQRLDREAMCSKRVPICSLPLKVSVTSLDNKIFELLILSVILNDINDNGPKFPQQKKTLRVWESSPVGSTFAIPPAIDGDTDKYSITVYRIIQGDTTTFNITYRQNANGMLELFIILNRRLDREKFDGYQLNIESSEKGYGNRNDHLNVIIEVMDVNDEPPMFAQTSYKVIVPENATIGYIVLQVSATDMDTGQGGVVTYSLDYDADPAIQSTFAVNSSTGTVTTKNSLDFETRQYYDFFIFARDSGLQSLSSHVAVHVTVEDVNDNYPVIQLNTEPRNNAVHISEHAKINSFVAYFSVFDIDAGNNGVVNCVINSDKFILFKPYEDDYQLLLNTSLDVRQKNVFNVKVTCSDKGFVQKTASKVIVVNVVDENDHAPKFEKHRYTATVTENNSPGLTLLTVTARDSDPGLNGQIKYELIPRNSRHFNIHPNNGTITITSSLDRESENNSTITFGVVATDSGKPPLSTNITVTVDIEDENDNSPRFDTQLYELNVTETSPIDVVIGLVRATDLDKGQNGKVSYYIVQSPQFASDFRLSSSDGIIRTAVQFDRELRSSHTFQVVAKDGGYPRKESVVFVKVMVNDINDNAPVVRLPKHGAVELAYNFPVGGVIVKVAAYDIDEGSNSRLSFYLINSSISHLFFMDIKNGEITLIKPLDKLSSEARNRTLSVLVKDHGDPPLATIASISLAILPPNRYSATSSGSENHNLIIVVVLVAASTLISIAIVGAIYILHSRRRNDRLKLKKHDAFDRSSAMYSERSDASTTNSECRRYHERTETPAGEQFSKNKPDVLESHCNDYFRYDIMANPYQCNISRSTPAFHETHYSQYPSSDDRRTNHERSFDDSGSPSPHDSQFNDDVADWRIGMRNSAQQSHIRDLSKKHSNTSFNRNNTTHVPFNRNNAAHTSFSRDVY